MTTRTTRRVMMSAVVMLVHTCALLAVMGAQTASGKIALPSFGDESLVGNASALEESMRKQGVSVAEAAARQAAVRAGTRVLGIVAKGVKAEEVYGTVLAGMRTRGFQVTLATAEDKIDMPLEEYGHVLLLSNSLGRYSADEIIDYVNSGGNVIVTCSLSNDAALTTFLNTFNVFVSDKYMLQDNIKYNAADKQTDRANVLLQAESVAPWMATFVNDFASLRPILAPSSVAMRYSTTSGYVSSALAAPRTSFSVTAGGSLSDMKKVIAGLHASVVAAVQTKKNSRILVMATDALCSNTTFETKVRMPGTKTKMPNGNRKFCEAAFKWAFQEVGVLRSSDIRHVHSGTQTTKALYSINDEMKTSLTVQEWTGSEWIPYKTDLQIELVMLDPYIRRTFEYKDNGEYEASFRVPDKYGVYKLVVEYFSFGYSWIDLSVETPVRPLKSSEYERFIPMQLPYYSSLLTVITGFLIMTTVFLYSK